MAKICAKILLKIQMQYIWHNEIIVKTPNFDLISILFHSILKSTKKISSPVSQLLSLCILVTDAEVEIFFLKWSQVGGSNRVIIFAKIDKKSTLAKFENRPNKF